MKVVLFCGGLGMRLREYSEAIPKPMIEIGYRPILWHLMRYYAHYGHHDFILCLGYRGDYIKKYFLDYNECVSNDFKLSMGKRSVELVSSDVHDWTISMIDTGLKSNIGERLRRVRKYLGDEEVFFANYSDGLSDLPLDEYLDFFNKSGCVAAFVSVRPNHSFHVVSFTENGGVEALRDLSDSRIWTNGGFFIFRREIFDYIERGEDMVEEPFRRLIERDQLLTYRYQGFWTAMDTFKDKQRLDDQHMGGDRPWEVWKS